ncbi:MAG: hypothetical protein ACJAZO_003534 [Myxococcota bacterium]
MWEDAALENGLLGRPTLTKKGGDVVWEHASF